MNGSGGSAWPTANAGPQNDSDQNWQKRREICKARHGNNGFGLTLGMLALIAVYVLRAAAERAAAVLVAQLEDSDPAVSSAAARTLLDRVGVPRAEVVQTAPSPLDLSGLSAAELDSLEGLLSRVGGGQ